MSGAKSSMTGKEISRGRGLSFNLIGKKGLPSLIYEETTAEEGKRMSMAGNMGMLDSNGGAKVGLEKKVVAMKNPPLLLGNIHNHSYPFICAPLKNGECSVGVLGVDSFGLVGKGRSDDKIPENGVVSDTERSGASRTKWLQLNSTQLNSTQLNSTQLNSKLYNSLQVSLLEIAGKELGLSIDRKRKLTNLEKFELIVDDVFVTASDVYLEALKIIANNVLTR